MLTEIQNNVSEKQHNAAILYIKNGLSLRAVADALEVSKSTIQKWSFAGKWQDLRPDTNKNRSEAQTWQAQILYLSKCLNLTEISERLNVSMPTLKKWKDAGRWHELRIDLEIMNQYKAAALYIEKGLTEIEISEKLNISKVTIMFWIDLYGWNASRMISQSQDVTIDIVEDFSRYFKSMFPNMDSEIQLVKKYYIKKISPKK